MLRHLCGCDPTDIRGEHQLAALRHRIPRIDRKVQNHMLQQRTISQDFRQFCFGCETDFDVIAQSARKQGRELLHDVIDLKCSELNLVSSTEGLKLSGQSFGSINQSLNVRPQKVVNVDANSFLTALGGSHDLKYGVGYRRVDAVSGVLWPGNGILAIENSPTDRRAQVFRQGLGGIVAHQLM